MSSQLDILALEPYHGGVRRAMLDALSRCSRHRWTILKLPPRRLERRLLVSATWFAEHLSRNEVGNVDLVFASEALNLADFFRQRPDLSNLPSVVYFHDNQLPDHGGRFDTPTDLVNLNSAMAATEIWFNSLYNLKTFLRRASGMVSRHPELQARNPMPSLTAKAHLIPPPIDLTQLQETAATYPVPDPRSVLLDARGADQEFVAMALALVQAKKEPMKLTLIGRVGGLPDGIDAVVLRERDDAAHVRALLDAGTFLSARENAASCDLTVRALAIGRLPLVPCSGVFPELLPEPLHTQSFHDGSPESMADRLLEAFYSDPPTGMEFHIEELMERFDAIRACRTIDERLECLTAADDAVKV